MKEIQLTQGKVALVDNEDFEWLNQFKWHTYKNGNIFYVRRNSPYINGKQIGIHMHHAIMGKLPKNYEVDHKNNNGLDNQRHNLRFVTHRQNMQNQKHKKEKSSQYLGIYWHKASKRWMARIVINGVQKYLGCFTNEFEAFTAYKQAVEGLGETIVGDR